MRFCEVVTPFVNYLSYSISLLAWKEELYRDIQYRTIVYKNDDHLDCHETHAIVVVVVD